MAEKKKPDVRAPEGVKDSRNREDQHRQDKRPKPLGPASGELDRALADGTIEPDPETPPRTPRE
jgi:hypothetical protein